MERRKYTLPIPKPLLQSTTCTPPYVTTGTRVSNQVIPSVFKTAILIMMPHQMSNRFPLLQFFSDDTAFIELWIHFNAFLHISHQYNMFIYFHIWLLEVLRVVICIPTFLKAAFNKNFLICSLYTSFKYLKFGNWKELFSLK